MVFIVAYVLSICLSSVKVLSCLLFCQIECPSMLLLYVDCKEPAPRQAFLAARGLSRRLTKQADHRAFKAPALKSMPVVVQL